ncbi:MAG TPA: O-antigen ligase family protein [bacterium]|nr:O-antigen ligase family protein [bacterium]HQJ65913.1 O-antigen ligase family protein [bacterium]
MNLIIIIFGFILLPAFLLLKKDNSAFINYMVFFPMFDMNLLTGNVFSDIDEYIYHKAILGNLLGGFGLDLNGARLIIWVFWLIIYLLVNHYSSSKEKIFAKNLMIYLIFLTWAAITLTFPTADFNFGSRFLLKLVYPILFFIIFLNHCDFEKLHVLLKSLSVVCFINVLFSIILIVYRGDLYNIAGTHLGARGFNLHPFPYGFMLCNCISYKLFIEKYTHGVSIMKVYIGVALLTIGVILSLSRITWVLLLFIFLIYSKKKVLFLLTVIASVFIIALTFKLFNHSEILASRIGIDLIQLIQHGEVEAIGEGYGTASGRTAMWLFTINTVLTKNPFFGLGLGGTEKYYLTTLNEFTLTHNEYVRIFSETGLIGLFLFLFFFYSFLSFFRATTKDLKTYPDILIVYKYVVACLCMLVLTFLTDNTLNNYFVIVLPFLSFAVFLKYYKDLQNECLLLRQDYSIKYE